MDLGCCFLQSHYWFLLRPHSHHKPNVIVCTVMGPIGKRRRKSVVFLSAIFILECWRYPPFSPFIFFILLQMLHTHLLFPSPHSHASPFLFPSRTNALRSRTFPATSIRGDSSSLRFRSHGCRIRNSAENDVVSETEHSKLPVTRAYPFHEIEPKWQRFWEYNRTFRTPDDDIDTSKPKYYVLDMFPYPRFLNSSYLALAVSGSLELRWEYYIHNNSLFLQWSWASRWPSTGIYCHRHSC